MKDENYFTRQIEGLILILSDGLNSENPTLTIHRDYVIEKLKMILDGGIGFHPLIIERLIANKKLSN